MFRENQGHRQMKMFGIVKDMPVGVQRMMDKSWAPVFRKHIFEKVDERRYAGLYSDKKSRPNFPVNIWIGLEIIKGMNDLTDEELLEQFHFNVLTAHAVGLEGLGEVTVCARTLYYNRARLLEYEQKTGCNLLEEECKGITDETLQKLSINSKTQRMDSSFVGSFIKQMSRLELIVKVAQNFYHDISEEERTKWKERLACYLEQEAEQVCFRFKRAEIGHHLKTIGELLFELHEYYAEREDVVLKKSYRHISRVLAEQFTINKEAEKVSIEVKPVEEIKASSMQNPADDEATYRKKGKQESRGYVFNIAETCEPDNELQLITDISVHQNIVSDDTILQERI